MKKITRAIAASAILVALMSSCASTKNVEKAPKAKIEKSAKADKKQKAEKPAKEEKAKSEKAAKPAKVKKVKFDQAAYNAAFEAGDYATCLGMISSKNNQNDMIKDHLDADMLMYLLQDYTGSGKGFLETYGEMQQVSSSMTAGDVMKAALISETSVKYTGAEYERYLAWSMRLANAMNLGQADVAKGIMKDYTGTFMAEIQALRQKNKELAEQSEKNLESDEYKNAQKALSAVGGNFNFGSKPTSKNETYENSPFFNYLGTLAFAMNNDFDHAADFASLNKVANVNEVVKVPAGKGRLEVIALSGTIGKRSDSAENKEAEGVIINVAGRTIPLFTKVAYPVFKPQNHLINKVEISLSDGTVSNASVIEDFDKAVAIDVDQKAGPAYSRSVFRNIVKNSAAAASIIAAGEGLKKAEGNPIALKAADLAFNKAVDVAAVAVVEAEKADTRQGECFPNKANAAGFSVAPGTYTVTIKYLNGNNVVETKTIENVVVNEGKVSVAVSSCEK